MAAGALITGASGLLGTHMMRHWNYGQYEPIVVQHERDDLLIPGVPTALVKRHRPALVIHLAWAASGTPGYRSSSENDQWLSASLELQRACELEGAWLIATGTSLDDVANSSDSYSRSKHQLRRELNESIVAGRMTWIQPFYVIDVDWRRPALVAESLAARDLGSPVSLRDPESTHDFVLGSDVGRAIVNIVQFNLRGVVPIGSGESRPVREVVEMLGTTWVQAMTSADPIERPQNHAAADIAPLRRINWSPDLTTSFFSREG
jgi:nucleoside-diphosphate-sugar epimerase